MRLVDGRPPVGRRFRQPGTLAAGQPGDRVAPEKFVARIVVFPDADTGHLEHHRQAPLETGPFDLDRFPLTPGGLDDFQSQALKQTVLADDTGKTAIHADDHHVPIAETIHPAQRLDDGRANRHALHRSTHDVCQLEAVDFDSIGQQRRHVPLGQDADGAVFGDGQHVVRTGFAHDAKHLGKRGIGCLHQRGCIHDRRKVATAAEYLPAQRGTKIRFADDAKNFAGCPDSHEVPDPMLPQQLIGGTYVERHRRRHDRRTHQFADGRRRRHAVGDVTHHVRFGDDSVETFALADHQAGNPSVAHLAGGLDHRRLRGDPADPAAHDVGQTKLGDRLHVLIPERNSRTPATGAVRPRRVAWRARKQGFGNTPFMLPDYPPMLPIIPLL